MDSLLKNLPLKPEDNLKLHTLVKNTLKTQSLLKRQLIKSQEQPQITTLALDEIQKKYDSKYREKEEYCENCGSVNNHNFMNGKPWCLKCNRFLIVTYKKTETKINPKLKGISVEEQQQFFLRQKQLGIQA